MTNALDRVDETITRISQRDLVSSNEMVDLLLDIRLLLELEELKRAVGES